MKSVTIYFCLLVLLSITACTKKKSKFSGPGDFPIQKPVPGSVTEAELSDASLVWKRYRTFEQGLMAGLELTKAQLCSELGQFNCIDKVHLVALGGNEPFDNAQHERPEKPSVLTAVAVSRIILSACQAKVNLDEQAGVAAATVFKFFNLQAASVANNEASELVTELYRRLLSRDPLPAELNLALANKDKFSSTKAMAVSLCYAIGSQAENVFL